MADPATTIGIFSAAAYVSKDLVLRVLGPTADYLGNSLQGYAQKRAENVGRIFAKAATRLGDKVNEEGAVPPRVLRSVLNEGSFCDDELSAEYFGGVLASSRTVVGRDDRGAMFSAMLSRMSTYQIRTHYIIYTTLRSVFKERPYQFNVHDRPKMNTFVPLEGYARAMEFSPQEAAKIASIVQNTMFSLHREALIDDFIIGGRAELMKPKCPKATTGGIGFRPSALGAELYLWAMGLADAKLGRVVRGEELPLLDGIQVPAGCGPCHDPESE